MYSTVLAGALILSLGACKSKKGTPIEKTTGASEISLPFSDGKYYSDKEFFRTKGSGNSVDLETSRKMALHNSRTALAQMIEGTIKSVTEQYTNDRKIDKGGEFSKQFQETSRDVVNRQLSNVTVFDEKVFKETNGSFTYWVAIQADKESILNGLARNISANKKLEQDYDKKKFEEIFNSEMDKLAKERNGGN